jgi:hypothetical protein
MSPDPLAIHGVAGDPNPYAFVRGSPMAHTDPTGLDEGGGGCNNTDPGCEEDNSISVSATAAAVGNFFKKLGQDFGDAAKWVANKVKGIFCGIFSCGGGGGGGQAAPPPPPPPPSTVDPYSGWSEMVYAYRNILQNPPTINWWRVVDPNGAGYGAIQDAKVALDSTASPWDRASGGVMAVSTFLPLTDLDVGLERGVADFANGGIKYPEGSFSVSDWTGYPEGMPRPNGPLQVLSGEEYTAARTLANETNAEIRAASGLEGSDLQIHEIQPVKFGGSPTDMSNKMLLPMAEHVGPEGVHPQFWNPLLQWVTGGGG